MMLEEAKLGGVDEELRGQLKETREGLAQRLEKMQDELHAAWKQWDAGDTGATARMVEVLNRRSYLRNLERDINDVLQ
jgi:molecular chaperone HscB